VTNASIVIVNFNSGRFLEACIETVCCSDCSHQIIVVDNGSTDKSIAFLEQEVGGYKSIQLIKNTKNLGFSAAINQGFEVSASDNILFLNPDCLIFPHTVRALCEVMAEDTSIGIIGGLVFNFDGSEQKGCRRREPTMARSLIKALGVHSSNISLLDMSGEQMPKELISVDAVSGSFFMTRREIFLSVNGMDEQFFLHFEDLDICRRIREIGKKVIFAPGISIFHFQGASNEISKHIVSMEKHRSMWLYQRKHNQYIRWLSGVVFLVIWTHFWVKRVTHRFSPDFNVAQAEKGNSLKRREFPWLAITKNDDEKRLLLFGEVNQLQTEVRQFGEKSDWSIYATCEETAPQGGSEIRWVRREYFVKVPPREALGFEALFLLHDKSLCVQEIGRLIDVCGIARIAIVKFESQLNQKKNDEYSNSTSIEKFHHELSGELSKIGALQYEIRTFDVSLSQVGEKKQQRRFNNRRPLEDCFFWLYKMGERDS